MKTQELELDEVRKSVREHYGAVAISKRGCGCAPTCCSTAEKAAANTRTADAVSQALGYSADEISAVPEGANLGLGSGAGFDAFLASKAVGPTGLLIGVDMTADMVSKARKNKAMGGYTNVEFRLGEIENLPVAEASVDVIISNCVINLAPDKAQVFREAFRVLKHGGRLAISDMLATAALPPDLLKDLELHVGCVAGAWLIEEVKSGLRAAGFANIRVEPKPQSREFIREWFPGRGVEDYVVSGTIEAVKT